MSVTSKPPAPAVRQRVDTADATSLGGRGPEVALPLAALAAAETRDAVYGSLIAWLGKQPKCAAAGFSIGDPVGGSDAGGSERDPHSFHGPAFENTAFEQAVAAGAAAAARSGSVQATPVEKMRNLVVVSVPVQVAGDRCDVLSGAIVVQPGQKPDDSPLLAAAAWASLWHAMQARMRTEQHLATTAATLDLLGTLQAADNFRSGTIALVNALREHLQCRAVVLGLTRGAGRCRIAAVSGLAEFDAQSLLTRSLEDALDETLVRDRLSVFPADDASNRDALLAHRKLGHDVQAVRVVSHPLTDTTGITRGAWLVIDDRNTAHSRATPTLLRVAAPRVAETLGLARRANGLLSSRRGSAGWRWFAAGLVAAAAVCGTLLLPVPYRIMCDCAAEPDVRRFIVAPHEGLLEQTFVQPGDVVTRGQLLARMDGRDVRWELAGLAAEREKAGKDRDAGLLDGDVAAAQRATLELKRIAAREQVLIRRRDGLELTAPIDGVVLEGHLDRVENAPVTLGQALYEVAPLSPVTVEIAVPDDEFSQVAVGAAVVVRFDGIGGEFSGTLQRIHPRSEVRDGHNIFIGEALLTNADHQLRPGMTGYARISGGPRSLGWTLFHRPWEHFRKSLPF